MQIVDDLSLFRDMQRIEEPLELWNFVLRCLQERGAQSVIYHRYAGIGPARFGADGIRVMADGVPDDWLSSYILDKAFLDDPFPSYARLIGRPFFWSEVTDKMRLTPRQTACFDAQRQAGLLNGVGMHIFGPELRDAYCGVALPPDLCLSEADIMAWQSIVQMAHLRGCALRSGPYQRALDLAPREQEILQWIARGKSNAVIARILGISPHTIDTLVRRMFEKLDVSNRTSAAIKGVGLGQVLLN